MTAPSAPTLQPVEVGGSVWIHARSRTRKLQTVCGLHANGLVFTDTDQPITCPYCSRDLTKRLA